MENAVLGSSAQPKRTYTPGRVQVFFRSGNPRTPPIFAHISATGQLVHEGSGSVFWTKTDFFSSNSVSRDNVRRVL
jgi:hypothetical protein